jgi:hypothetical protein
MQINALLHGCGQHAWRYVGDWRARSLLIVEPPLGADHRRGGYSSTPPVSLPPLSIPKYFQKKLQKIWTKIPVFPAFHPKNLKPEPVLAAFRFR